MYMYVFADETVKPINAYHRIVPYGVLMHITESSCPLVPYGALLSVHCDGCTGDGWYVEEEWLFCCQSDHQLSIPSLQRSHV